MKSKQQLIKLIGWAMGLCLAVIILVGLFDTSSRSNFRAGWDSVDCCDEVGGMQERNLSRDFVKLSKINNEKNLLNDDRKDAAIKSLKEEETLYSYSYEEGTNKKPIYLTVLLIFSLIIYTIMFVSIVRLVKLFSKGEVLTKSTYKNLLLLAFSIILTPVVDYLYAYAEYLQQVSYINLPNFSVVNEAQFNVFLFLLGFIFLGLVVAVKIGIEIKEENELTI